jgi:hypothetical protein
MAACAISEPAPYSVSCIEDFAKVLGAAGGKFLFFDTTPESLYGIQIGGVTRKPLHAEPTALGFQGQVP